MSNNELEKVINYINLTAEKLNLELESLFEDLGVTEDMITNYSLEKEYKDNKIITWVCLDKKRLGCVESYYNNNVLHINKINLNEC